MKTADNDLKLPVFPSVKYPRGISGRLLEHKRKPYENDQIHQSRASGTPRVVNELRLRVTSSGSKSFCVSRKRDVKFYRVTLGKFPDMTIEQARERAYNALSEVAITRRNPNERRREEKNGR
ncbi:Arm DNA-binding domain-containing protein [Citrobacter sp. wls713]|uniref:Arm DNA-binding domain-containing protein n=1 Tax=Citrobacter sp. wls713 TaxID=2576423 RepID=UPI0020171754|nr:Arm DNA-binding domain-containing protein [Citrobacter sp. wls713]